MMMDWESSESYVFLNPRTPPAEKQRLSSMVKNCGLPGGGYIFLATSGSTALPGDDLKWVVLSKEAILSSAASVNQHLDSNSRDVILNPLPTFHIGGLSVYARAFLSGAKVIDCGYEGGGWKLENFLELMQKHKVTLTSLVPTQIFDLVVQNIRAPESLRAAVVGGGVLSPDLYFQALELGWPLLPSYGMTECSSQVATVLPGEGSLENCPLPVILKHVKVKTSSEGKICIASSSLLSGYLRLRLPEGKVEFQDPCFETLSEGKVRERWLETSDKGELSADGQRLKILGREGEVAKVGGENVSLSRLDGIFSSLILTNKLSFDAGLYFKVDERLGHYVAAAFAGCSHKEAEHVTKLFNERVFPFERIREIHLIPAIPRTALGKLRRSLLASFCIAGDKKLGIEG